MPAGVDTQTHILTSETRRMSTCGWHTCTPALTFVNTFVATDMQESYDSLCSTDFPK